ncbi:PREDICTED: uncharacterized protein LOC104799666 [Tarenaya hassleriana]|uniref:uncharacterized protein LOC104799666 n=1 Tax=Tarenaya hassleriana TaxID=28532 RepID=UPI00053C7FB7|nr:PREDICTED: uncharacterized protein LOC104799666 [Tarenaya hassleriana]
MLGHLSLTPKESTSTLIERAVVGQRDDPLLARYMDHIEDYSLKGYRIDEQGALRLGNRLCVPNDQELRREILSEAHQSKLAIHPGASKMYQGLRRWYTWPRIKRDVADYVARCLTCQQVKAERQMPGGESHDLIRGLDEDAWRVVEEGWDFSEVIGDDGTKVIKPSSQWTLIEKKASTLNAKALTIIFNTVDSDEFKQIQGCKTAKEA